MTRNLLATLLIAPAAALAVAVASPSGIDDLPAYPADAQAAEATALPALPEPAAMLAAQRADSLLERATELYDSVKTLRLAGPDINAAVYFPTVYDASTAAIEALEARRDTVPGGADMAQSPQVFMIKELLRGLNGPLEQGAFHYSGLDDKAGLARFARRFLDVHLLPEFKGEQLPRQQSDYAAMTYIAASDAYNKKEFGEAIKYFKLYFTTGDTASRETVYTFMGQAALNSADYELAVVTLLDGVKSYPANQRLRDLAIKACVEGGHGEHLEGLATDGLAFYPDTPKYLEILGCLDEDNLDFLKASERFQRLDELMPRVLSTTKHIALCYYNTAVQLFNQAQTTATSTKEASRLRRKAKNYFDAAAVKLEEIAVSEPDNLKYLRSLGVSYLCLERQEDFGRVNARLKALGADPLANVFMPPMMSYDNVGYKNFTYGGASGKGEKATEAPPYSEFGKRYVNDGLAQWVPRGEFESLDDYNNRLARGGQLSREIERLNREAQEKYIARYSGQLRLTEVELMPYDITNETFMVATNFGPFYLKVPNRNGEAETFKAEWGVSQFLNTRFCIGDNDRVAIAALTVLTPSGKKYEWNDSQAIAYRVPDVEIDLDGLLRQGGMGQGNMAQATGRETAPAMRVTALSDVDENIPVTRQANDDTYVLIIANENYENVGHVQSALHDGEVFRTYCIKTLGIPEANISYGTDVSLANMRGRLTLFEQQVATAKRPADAIVYYAGHGMPDDASRDAYLLPVDGHAQLPAQTGLPLDELLTDLGKMGANTVTVFIDACFSGARRDGQMLKSGRAVAFAPKKASPHGNMLVFTATTGQETAMPWAEKNHGLFTYYLLKHLQLTKGNTTLGELTEYVTDNVRRQSVRVNSSAQNPDIRKSGTMEDQWKKHELRK